MLELPDTAEKFARQYNAKIEESHYRWRRMRQPHITDYNCHAIDYVNFEVEEERFVAVHVPPHEFSRMLDSYVRVDKLEQDYKYHITTIKKLQQDEQVRRANPSVQLAYEKYLMMLELARG